MTQTSTTRRAATVSGGVLLLCLSFGGTALAATTPASGSTLPTVADPVVAPTQTAILAAGQSPALAPRPVAGLPTSGRDERAPRGLLIAVATMVIGALAAGHVKVVQDRLSGISVS